MARLVPAVARALDTLELFLEHDTLGAPDIAARLGLPRTTVHELVHTLVQRQYLLEVGTDSKRFELGPATVALGQRYQDRVDLSRQGQLVSQSVSDQCNETVHVGILDEDSVIYIAKADSSHSVRMVSAVGRRLPAHCTAVGKALLSGLSADEFDSIYSQHKDLPKMTVRSIAKVDELRWAVAAVRETGIATEFCESNEDIACVAAPVRDVTGAIVAGISISVPTNRWNEDIRRQLGKTVQDGAADLTRRLGGTPFEVTESKRRAATRN